MLAPSRTRRALTPSTLASVTASGLAAATRMSQSTANGASGGPTVPRPNATTERSASFQARSSSTGSPAGSVTAPPRSLTATIVAPRWARKRAACAPTAPKPWIATRAPARLSSASASDATSAATASPNAVAPSSSSGIPPSTSGRPTLRPISSWIQAMQRSSVPMSGPGMYVCTSRIACANHRITFSLSRGGIAGSAANPALAPPCARPAAALFSVIARARRATSPTVTSGTMRRPPIPGPHAVLSTTTTARTPVSGSRSRTIASGPSPSVNPSTTAQPWSITPGGNAAGPARPGPSVRDPGLSPAAGRRATAPPPARRHGRSPPRGGTAGRP